MEVDDLIQAGMIGLLEAAAHYSSDRGASFETYAGIRIRGAMIDALRQLDWAPRSVHRKAREAADGHARHRDEARAAPPATPRVAAADGHPARRSTTRSCRTPRPASCPASMKWRASPTWPARSRIRCWMPKRGALRTAVAEAIAALPERERLVMSMYYDDELNLKEIGAVLGVSESRVCQLHGQALVRLRGKLASWRRDEHEERPMDLLSIIGIVLAFVALLVGAILKGAGLHALLSSAAHDDRGGGHLRRHPGADAGRGDEARLRHPAVGVPFAGAGLRAPSSRGWWSGARSRAARACWALSRMLDDEHDEFIRKGLQLVIDGSEPDQIRGIMEVDLDGREAADLRAAKVFEGMGVYAPTLGIIGAVLGLMAVMQNLGRSQQAGHRHRRGLHRHGVRHRPRQPVPAAHRQQAEDRRAGTEPTCAKWSSKA